jgi:hypothetical protein
MDGSPYWSIVAHLFFKMATYRRQGNVPAKCCHSFAEVVCIGVGLLVNYLYCGITLMSNGNALVFQTDLWLQ